MSFAIFRILSLTFRTSTDTNKIASPPSTMFRFSGLLLTCISVLLITGFLSGCTMTSGPAPDKTRAIRSAIILVPGYYGTRLVRQSDGSLIFISLSQILFGEQSLTLPVPGLGLTNTVDLKPSGIFEDFRVIPLFYSIDVYGSLLNRLQTATDIQTEVIPFSYDWRGDLMEAVRNLDALIHRLQDGGINNISIVAHSMGGLIVSYYLRYGAQDIDSAMETWEGAERFQKVVMAGVPYLGAMNSFRNMNFGVTVGWNSSLLSAEAYASFPATYYTLPVGDTDELLTPDLNPVKGLIRNAGQWQRAEWGLLKDRETLSPQIEERRAAYTSLWLNRSQRFLERLRTPTTAAKPHTPLLLYLYATGTPTRAKGLWKGPQFTGPESLFFGNSESGESDPEGMTNRFFEDGDGTVTGQSARLPAAYQQTLPTTIRHVEVGHTELVTDRAIQEDIVTFLEKPSPHVGVGD